MLLVSSLLVERVHEKSQMAFSALAAADSEGSIVFHKEACQNND
jgi:hypothetical protein